MIRLPLAVGLILCGVLSGCGSDGESHRPIDPAKLIPTSEPLPDREPIIGYPELRGAVAAVRYYHDLLNYAYRTMETRNLKEAGTPDCGTCKRLYGSIDTIRERGDHFNGGDGTIQSAELAAGSKGTTVRVVTTESAPPGNATDKNGQVTYVYPGQRSYRQEWAVTYVDGSWRVKEIYSLPGRAGRGGE